MLITKYFDLVCLTLVLGYIASELNIFPTLFSDAHLAVAKVLYLYLSLKFKQRKLVSAVCSKIVFAVVGGDQSYDTLENLL